MKNINYKYQTTKINIENKIAISAYLFTILNLLIITILFIINISILSNKIADLEISQEEMNNLKARFSFLLVSYLFNALFDVVYVIYVMRSVNKRQLGYVFVIFWFIIWLLFTIGLMFISEINIVAKTINLISGIGNASIALILFYKLQYRRREIQYEALKKRKNL